MALKGKISYNSPVILSFVFISIAVLAVSAISHGKFAMFLALKKTFSWQLLTYIFAHADIQHLTGNMMLMLLVGPVAEEKYGSKNLLIMTFSTAIISGILNCLLFHVGIMGASGIVFMLIVLSAFTNIQQGKIPLTLILVVICYLGNEVLTGVLSTDNISQFGHIAGGIMGMIWGFIYMYGDKEKSAES
ncbi:MAG: rhomboid family intramembrane serine protease [Ruminococcus sp.]|nr:rhomboid family intramembrane serine protease [Ruminococcus sp.]